MSDAQVVLLDGTPAGDESLASVLRVLTDVFRRGESGPLTFALRDQKLAHCLGCFGCWVETPGLCCEHDAGHDIARAVAMSEVTVLFTPVAFGGYGSELKRMVDRLVPLALPFFREVHGETHHPMRYPMPRLVAVGVQRTPDGASARIFRELVGRNAINMNAPSYAAQVVSAADDPAELRRRLTALLTRKDPWPVGKAFTSLMPASDANLAGLEPGRARHALIIVGSPKTKTGSTSGVLGSYLLQRLVERGWEMEALTLRASLRQDGGRNELLAAVDRADLLLLAFPMYVDALPYLVTRALELIAEHRACTPDPRPQRLAAFINLGFPEPHQASAALAICHQFALRSGIAWAGSLALGSGEGLSGGIGLVGVPRPGLLPIGHVVRALDLTATALADGHAVPAEAVALAGQSPIPLMPFGLWRRLFHSAGVRYWYRRAAGNGVAKERLRDAPWAAA